MNIHKKKLRNNPKKTIRQCSHECYNHYYKNDFISAKTAAGLINGLDARVDKITHSKHDVKNDLSKLQTAVTLNLISTKNNAKFRAECKLNTKEFFHWAIKNYPELTVSLPDHITRTPARNNKHSPTIISTTDPNDKEQLILEIERLSIIVHKLTKKNAKLNNKIKALKPLAKKWKRYTLKQSKRARKDRKLY